MAIVAGLTIYEVGMLAAGALAIMLASPPGQRATKAIADEISSLGQRADALTDAPPVPVEACPDKPETRECDPCPPPPPPQIHRDHPHGICQDHWHYFRYNQDPVSCVCYPQRMFGGCLGPDEEPPISWQK